ncbi:MAG: restriction endonuclease subunit S [Methylococcales symbiont of Hymedesmia sp. n. MRB-2018]|nr:MAG: restriction endonuclease subunit S [Methylococcales symbiont of Hymedesmia sp. n. MRB-2018]
MDKKLPVPQGYQQTEIGVIPQDWEVVRLGDVGSFIGGGTPSTRMEKYWNGNIPWVSSSDLKNSIHQIHVHRFITNDAINESATKKIPANSILIVSRVGVGKVAINKEIVCTSQDFQSLITDNNYIFLAYLIKNKTQLLISYNQGTSIKGFVKDDLKNLKIPLPPKPEQQKIADILTTWDNAIEKQTALIEKKQQLKKGLMQQLLTGKTRFSEFSGDWGFYKLGDLLDYEQPTKYLVSNTDYDTNYNTPVLTAGKTFILGYTNEKNGIYNNNLPVIIFDDFTTATKFVNFYFKAKSSAMKILKAKNKLINIRLVYELMQMINYATNDHKRYWISEYQEIDIKLPSTKEQQKIAQVLTLADDEITQLQTELALLKTQKKGLMQQLLTGKIRVKF